MILGSISAALSCPVSVPPWKESSGEERGLFSRTAAGNRAYDDLRSRQSVLKRAISQLTFNILNNFAIHPLRWLFAKLFRSIFFCKVLNKTKTVLPKVNNFSPLSLVVSFG